MGRDAPITSPSNQKGNPLNSYRVNRSIVSNEPKIVVLLSVRHHLLANLLESEQKHPDNNAKLPRLRMFCRFTNGNALPLETLVEMNNFKQPSFQPLRSLINSSQWQFDTELYDEAWKLNQKIDSMMAVQFQLLLPIWRYHPIDRPNYEGVF